MNQILKYRSQKLRGNSSQAEKIIWSLLRNRNLSRFKFRRQHIIAPYIVDFVCLRKKLIIEMDGDHHELQKKYDMRRTNYLESLGYKVLRFANTEVFNDRVDDILKVISAVLVN